MSSDLLSIISTKCRWGSALSPREQCRADSSHLHCRKILRLSRQLTSDRVFKSHFAYIQELCSNSTMAVQPTQTSIDSKLFQMAHERLAQESTLYKINYPCRYPSPFMLILPFLPSAVQAKLVVTSDVTVQAEAAWFFTLYRQGTNILLKNDTNFCSVLHNCKVSFIMPNRWA